MQRQCLIGIVRGAEIDMGGTKNLANNSLAFDGLYDYRWHHYETQASHLYFVAFAGDYSGLDLQNRSR